MAVDVATACSLCASSGGDPQGLFTFICIVFSAYFAVDVIFTWLVISRKSEESMKAETAQKGALPSLSLPAEEQKAAFFTHAW